MRTTAKNNTLGFSPFAIYRSLQRIPGRRFALPWAIPLRPVGAEDRWASFNEPSFPPIWFGQKAIGPRSMDHHPAAPTGHNEIAQGRAKRHPGSYAIALGTPPPKFAKTLKGRNITHGLTRCWVSPFQGSHKLFRPESQGGASLCPGLSPCAPLGLRTIGHRQPRESTDGYNFVE